MKKPKSVISQKGGTKKKRGSSNAKGILHLEGQARVRSPLRAAGLKLEYSGILEKKQEGGGEKSRNIF